MDLNGRVLQKGFYNDNNIDVSNLLNGIYIVAILQEDTFIGRAKFIKE